MKLFGLQELPSAVASTGKAIHAAWTAPAVLFAAFLIAWGAEAAQFFMSQGLALALLAWLQTLPEFAVEAELAWNAARGFYPVHYVTANFTGSIRLIMGFGMPMVYFIYTRFWSRERTLRPIQLAPFHSVEIISVFPPIIYFVYIIAKGTLDIFDSIVLLSFYALYLGLLLKMPPEEEEELSELPAVSRAILRRGRVGRFLGVTGIFVLGGAILYVTVHPFIQSLEALAVLIGVEQYVFIQWVAPFLSEMPEKVSAFNWARKENRVAMSLMNFLSSNINQLTVLVAMIPIVFAISAATGKTHVPLEPGAVMAFVRFDADQIMEIELTIAQAFLCVVLLLNMKFEWWDAVGMFVLFVVQFSSPLWAGAVGLADPKVVRVWTFWAYLAWVALEVALFLCRVRQWRFPMLAAPSLRLFKRHTHGPNP